MTTKKKVPKGKAGTSKAEAKRKTGRPPAYTRTISDDILDKIAGGKGLVEICKADGMPSRKTVHEWIRNNHDEFGDRYARARELQADHFAEEIITIADDSSEDVKVITVRGEEREVTDQEVIGRARLRVDARKWLASKLAPKKYGEKIEATHEAGDTLGRLLGEIDGTTKTVKPGG